MIHRIANLIGGLAIPKQLRLLKKRPHILIGTPGRISDLVDHNIIGLEGVK